MGYWVLRGSGVGDVIQNKTSPDFRFREVGISDSMVAILKISASVLIIITLHWVIIAIYGIIHNQSEYMNTSL